MRCGASGTPTENVPMIFYKRKGDLKRIYSGFAKRTEERSLL